MHIAFSKSLGDGNLAATSAGNWDELKYKLSTLDHHDTRDWDRHFAWENFRSGAVINDGALLWKYIDFEMDDILDKDVFEGRIVFLAEIDPIFD